MYACTDPLTHGHRARRAYVRLTAPDRAAVTRVDETAEQAAARAAATKEAETAQRRRVLAGNKAWRAAETVRRDYLRTLLARKTPPKGSGPYLATTLALDPFAITKAAEKGHELAATLLTGQQDIAGRERVAALAEGTSDARGQVIALGLILAGIEASTGVHSWRHADDRHGSDWRGESPALGRYLRFLVATGYPLAPIERFADRRGRRRGRRVHPARHRPRRPRHRRRRPRRPGPGRPGRGRGGAGGRRRRERIGRPGARAGSGGGRSGWGVASLRDPGWAGRRTAPARSDRVARP